MAELQKLHFCQPCFDFDCHECTGWCKLSDICQKRCECGSTAGAREWHADRIEKEKNE